MIINFTKKVRRLVGIFMVLLVVLAGISISLVVTDGNNPEPNNNPQDSVVAPVEDVETDEDDVTVENTVENEVEETEDSEVVTNEVEDVEETDKDVVTNKVQE